MKTEKVTINLSAVELAQIDFLVDRGLYSNRSDFIRLASRKQISEHQKELDKYMEAENDYMSDPLYQKASVVGIMQLGKNFLNEHMLENKYLDIKVVGMLIISKDVDFNLAQKVIKKCKIHGKIIANPEIKKYIEDLNNQF